MATPTKDTFVLPQDTVKVSVKYYSKREKANLSKYSTASAIDAVVASGVEIPTAEFLTYYLFKRKRLEKAGWSSYRELGARINVAITDLSEWIDFNGVSISTPVDVAPQDKSITERIGESIGMSVLNRIHRLTEADWDKVPERPGQTGFPTFDYDIAADNLDIVQLEAKGSSIADNAFKASTVSKHRSDISQKKLEIAKREKSGEYEFPADLRYGTITVVGENPEDPVRCYLVDPPPDGDSNNARRLRLLLRISFLAEFIAFLSPRSQLAASLQSRLAALCRLREPFSLDKVALRGASGDPFEFGVLTSGHSSFFSTRSRITDSRDGGVVLPLERGKRIFFLGIRQELLELAVDQDFPAILSFSATPGSVRKTIDCVFTENTIEEVELPAHLAETVTKSGIYRTVRLDGELFYSQGGLVFGVLPIN